MDSDTYPEAYFMGGGASNYVNYGNDAGWDLTMDVLTEFLPSLPGIDLLEVGCATGWFVAAARARGLAAWGVDVSTWAIAHPAPGVGDYLWQGSVLDLDSRSLPYDVVVSWEVLEHIPQEVVPAALDVMLTVSAIPCLWVHRIALSDGEHDHHADTDATHVTLKPRAWWQERFAALGGLTPFTPRPDIEAALDEAFKDRDWAGRFFAFEV